MLSLDLIIIMCNETKEKIRQIQNEYSRAYYEINRKRINEKFNCPCGGRYSRLSVERHKRTNKHQKFLKQSSQNSH